MINIVNKYIDALLKNGYEKNSVSTKNAILKRFVEYLKGKNLISFNDVDVIIIDGFKNYVKEFGFKKTTNDIHIKRLKEFFNYLVTKNIISSNPFSMLKKKIFGEKDYPDELKKYYEKYIELKTNEDTCYNSMKKIKQSMNVFFKYLTEKGINKFSEIEKEDVKEFIKYLVDLKDDTGKSIYQVQSVNRIIAGLKPFIIWMSKKGVFVKGLSNRLKYLRNARHLHRNILTRKELVSLFNVKAGNLYEFMMKGIFIIQYATGLRINEVLGLKLSDIDFENKELKIFESKTKRERVVMIGEVGITYLRIIIDHARNRICFEADKTDDVFISYLEGKMLNENTVNRYLKALCKKANITKTVTTHCFRHSYGTHLLENGLGIKQVSDLLGHRDLASTEQYTRLNPERLRKTIDHCHPREKESLCQN